MRIKVLNEKPLEYITFPESYDMIYISDDEERLLLSGRPVKLENGRVVIDEEEEELSNYEALKTQLRERREVECFSYVNRGWVWSKQLTKEQREELEDWYIRWLKVTETFKIPNKPEWLK